MQTFHVHYKITFLLAGKTQIVFETLDVMRLWQNTVRDITTYHYNRFVVYSSAWYKLVEVMTEYVHESLTSGHGNNTIKMWVKMTIEINKYASPVNTTLYSLDVVIETRSSLVRTWNNFTTKSFKTTHSTTHILKI